MDNLVIAVISMRAPKSLLTYVRGYCLPETFVQVNTYSQRGTCTLPFKTAVLANDVLEPQFQLRISAYLYDVVYGYICIAS